MGINVSEIQDKTLLKYAQKVDDSDGNLNEQEMNSLFETLNTESQKASGRLEAAQKMGIGRTLGTSALWTGGFTGYLALLAKKHPNNVISRSIGFPKFAGLLFAGCVATTAIAMNHVKKHNNSKLNNLDAAIAEFNQLRAQRA